MKVFKITFLIFAVSLLSCGTNNSEKSTSKEKKVVKKDSMNSSKIVEKESKKVEKTWDSLTARNVIPFFTEFGKQNKKSIKSTEENNQ